MGATHVLVVDDDFAMARAVEMIMQARGYHVKVAHDANEALDLIVGCEPDLVLLDVMLPEMDGYELLDKLIELRAITPDAVIVMSALASNADLQRAHDAGVCSYLRKPFTTDQLIMTVEECLEIRHVAVSKTK